MREVSKGEAEAIALAIELKADLLLLDERRGRRVAARYRLRITSLGGILIEAKQQGLLTTVRPTLDALQAVGYRISQRLYEDILRAAGE
jgi:predicted nucleic acid-binding protein